MTRPHAFFAAIIFFAIACDGGGCGGCGCLEPLEGGFPVDRLANSSGQVRLTGAALDFIEANIDPILGEMVGLTCPGGEVPCPAGSACVAGRCNRGGRPIPTLGFRVPYTNSSGARICRNASPGECNVYIDIRNMNINPIDPDRINIEARLDINSTDIPVKYSFFPTCDMTLRAQNKRLIVPLQLRTDNPLRRLSVEVGDPEFSIDSNDVRLCGGLDWLRPVIIGLMSGSINDSVRDAIRDAVDDNLYQACADGCPAQTECRGSTCYFPGTDQKVPVAMGVEGRLNLAAVMGQEGGLISGAVDIGLLAGGNAGSRAGGVELGLMGGAEVAEVAACVTELTGELPDITPVQFSDSTVERCEGRGGECADGFGCSDGYCVDGDGARQQVAFHIGIGIAQQYLDHMLRGFHQGGALCLNVGSELSESISTSTLSLLMPSLNDLVVGHQALPSPMRLAIVPFNAPRLEVGSGRYELVDGERLLREPLLHIKVEDLAIHFQVFVQDRFIRVATVLLDLNIGMGMTLDGDNNLVLTMSDASEWIGDIEVRDADILVETEAEIAEAIPVLLELALPQLLGGLDTSVPLPPFGIFALDIEAIAGERLRAERGDDGFDRFDYLGLFASLRVVRGQPDTLEVGTRARLVRLTTGTTAGYSVTTAGPLYEPEVLVALHFSGAGNADYEYSWRVDEGVWRHYQPAADGAVVRLRSPVFSLQGPHRVALRGRLAGVPATTDRSPAMLELMIDTEAPQLRVRRLADGSLAINAHDRVWPDDSLALALLADGAVVAEAIGALSADWPADAIAVTVRAEDGAGQVATAVLLYPEIEALEPVELIGPFQFVEPAQGCSCDATGLASLLWLLPVLLVRRRRHGRAA